jgi:uncharacterized protein YbaR (Trm112 family)
MGSAKSAQCRECGVSITVGANATDFVACPTCGAQVDVSSAKAEGAVEIACPLPRCRRAIAVRDEGRGGVITCPGCEQPYRVVDEHPPRLRPIARPV